MISRCSPSSSALFLSPQIAHNFEQISLLSQLMMLCKGLFIPAIQGVNYYVNFSIHAKFDQVKNINVPTEKSKKPSFNK